MVKNEESAGAALNVLLNIVKDQVEERSVVVFALVKNPLSGKTQRCYEVTRCAAEPIKSNKENFATGGIKIAKKMERWQK